MAIRGVTFADDDSLPARDLITGEPVIAPGIAEHRRPRSLRSLEVGEVGEAIAPVTLAKSQRLDVIAPLLALLEGGIQRGSTIGVRGRAGLSLALSAAAGPMVTGSWLAVVGCGDLCLERAEQLGVVLHRTVVIDEPPPKAWGSVLGALFDGFDLVLVDGRVRIEDRQAQRLLSRVRERGVVLIDVAGVWPHAHDLVLEILDQQWMGLGQGHGLLAERRLAVEATGRRGHSRPRRVDVVLPGEGTGPEPEHAGSNIGELTEVDAERAVASPLRRVG